MSDIQLFQMQNNQVSEIEKTAALSELEIHNLFEKNLETLLNIRFLANEYRIDEGRIDSLGLDENNCPVIIEYKKGQNANIVMQGLFYLDWLMGHKESFQLLAMKKLGSKIEEEIDWSAPRLICIANSFNKYDIHAVKQVNRNIALMRYQKFRNDLLMLELLTAATDNTSPATTENSQSKTSNNQQRTMSEIIEKANDELRNRYDKLAEYLENLGEDVQKNTLKYYIAFKTIKNFACAELRPQIGHILVYVKLNINETDFNDDEFIRDVSNIGHFGTGNVEIKIKNDEDLERAKPHLQKSYENT